MGRRAEFNKKKENYIHGLEESTYELLDTTRMHVVEDVKAITGKRKMTENTGILPSSKSAKTGDDEVFNGINAKNDDEFGEEIQALLGTPNVGSAERTDTVVEYLEDEDARDDRAKLEDFEAITFDAERKAMTGWVLSNGRNVNELFAEYKKTAKGTDLFAKCHILDIADMAPVRKTLALSNDEYLWDEIEMVWDAKWKHYRPSELAKEYLKSLRMPTITEVRSALMKPFIIETYDVRLHYDLDYIHTIIHAFISMAEQKVNPLLSDSNSEEFWQVHVYGNLIDRLFFDCPDVQVKRGELASRAVSYRKNSHRQLGETKVAATKLDAAIVTRDTWRVELLTVEAGRWDSVEGQSKQLSDRYKLAKALKDQIDFIYKWLPAGQKQRITEVEVFGVLTSGLEGCVYALDLPCSGVYRFGELFRFELPRQFNTYELLIKSLARFLALKARLQNVLEVLQDINRTSTTQMLQESDSFWSPRRKREMQPTRSTPSSPIKKRAGQNPK